MIIPLVIKYESKPYDEMVVLRHKVLRGPLGLTFSEQDLEQDRNDILLGLSVPRPHRIATCCILSPIDENRVKLRQMAVEQDIQKSGIGTSMLKFAEFMAAKNGFGTITLHARKVAVRFYEKHGYEIVGEEFTEVGIPHFKMEKQLNSNMENEKKQVIEEVSKYVDLTVVPFGKPVRTILDIEKRDPMYDGNGVVYMLSLFEKGELVNNRIGTYMVLMNNGDQAGFHEHESKKEQELYVILNGEGEYIERTGADNITRKLNLKKGSVAAIQGENNYHSVINTGNEPLIIFVVTTYK